jgi:Anti-sigma-28 factor, FlgM
MRHAPGIQSWLHKASLDKKCWSTQFGALAFGRCQSHFRVKLLREVCHSKKSKFTAPLIVGCEETVPYGDFIDKALQLLVDDSADGVRWDKVARIKRALANGTYNVSDEDLAGRIVVSKGAEAQVALHARGFDHWSSLKQCLMRLSKSSWLRL